VDQTCTPESARGWRVTTDGPGGNAQRPARPRPSRWHGLCRSFSGVPIAPAGSGSWPASRLQWPFHARQRRPAKRPAAEIHVADLGIAHRDRGQPTNVSDAVEISPGAGRDIGLVGASWHRGSRCRRRGDDQPSRMHRTTGRERQTAGCRRRTFGARCTELNCGAGEVARMVIGVGRAPRWRRKRSRCAARRRS